MKKTITVLSFLVACCACNSGEKSSTQTQQPEKKYTTTGSVEILDPQLLTLLDSTATLEILAEGFSWSEGPLWIKDSGYVLFSDIPPNKIMRWDEKNGLREYLHPSGYTGTVQRAGEPGSNGLLLDAEGRLVMCQHGDRRVARMDAPLEKPEATFVSLADKFEGKRLNSPNDAVFSKKGDLYFTDPPYGLLKNVEDSAKEISFQGVYRLKKNGSVELITKELSRPNGIAFSPDEKKLYVANSDTNKIWMVFDVDDQGNAANGRLFFDATSYKESGYPDGMKVHSSGMVFATGPGGVMIFSPAGQLMGRVLVGDLASNLAFDENEKQLFITANHRLVRLKLK